MCRLVFFYLILGELHTKKMKVYDLESNMITHASLIFEWCMIECESKNGHYKDTCWKDVANVFKIYSQI